MKSKKIIALLCLSFALTNFVTCAPKNEISQLTVNTASETDNLQSIDNTNPHNIEGMFSNRDIEIAYNENSAVLITLSNYGITSSSKSVDISGSTVTISNSGTYLVRGNLSNGQIIIAAKKTDKIQLVLDNVTLNSNNSAPIYIKQADKVFITLANSSKNHLSTRYDFIAIDNNNIDAVIYSQEDLTLNGEGSHLCLLLKMETVLIWFSQAATMKLQQVGMALKLMTV